MLVGRATEEARLREAWESVRFSGFGAVGVEGPPGIGKTALLRSVTGTSDVVDAALWVTCDPLRAATPFGPLVDVWGPPWADGGSNADRPDPGRASPYESGTATAAGAAEVLIGRIAERAGTGPLVLIVDDVQWADTASLSVLAGVAHAAADLPLLLLLGGRSGALELRGLLTRFADDERRVDRIDLGPLEPAWVMTLAEAVIGATPGSSVQRTLAEGGGNPLLVLHLLDSLVRSSRLTDGASGVVEVVGRPEGRPLGRDVVGRLAGAEDRELAALAALLVAPFSVEELAMVANRSVTDALAAVNRMVDAGLLVTASEGIRFSHDLVRDAVAATIDGHLHADMHAHIATSLEDAGADALRVADHLLRTPSEADSSMASRLAAAGRSVIGRDPATAARLLEGAAVRCPLPDPGRDDLLADLGDALAWAGRLDEATAVAVDLDVRPWRPEAEARLRSALARALLLRGRCAPALIHVDRLVRLAESGHGELAWALAQRATVRLFSLDLDGALADARTVTDQAEQGSAAFVLAACTEAFVHNALGDTDVALALVDDAVRVADASTDGVAHRLHPNLSRGLVLQTAGRADAAAAAFARGAALGRALGARWAEPLYRYGAAVAHWDAGRWDDAMAESEAGIESSEATGSTFFRVFVAGLRGTILVLRDDLAAADRELAVGEELIAAGGPQYGIDWLMLGRALHLEASGDVVGARDLLRAVWDLAPGLQSSAALVLVGAELARLCIAVGDREGARSVAAGLGAGRSAESDPISSARRLAAAGIADGDDSSLMVAHEHAVSVGRPYEAARWLDEAARALMRRGAPDSARRVAAEAVAAYEMLGAVGLARRLAGVVGATGARSAARPTFGWGSLTPSELRILDEVSVGASNQDIADLLGVSRRTVEAHLRSVYRKLGLSTRVALVLALTERASGRVADRG